MKLDRIKLSAQTVRDNIAILEQAGDIEDAGYYLQLEHEKFVLECIEKQIPKKPIANFAKDYEGNIFDVTYSCPVCTRTICYESEGNLEEDYPYCHCGQAIKWLDWSDTE